MSERKRVSAEVADRLGISRRTLMVYLHRNPDLKPAERLPDNDFLWAEDEIQAVIDRRQRRNHSSQ